MAAGADPNLANLSEVTPLMGASFVSHAEIMQKLLAAGARTDAVDRVKKTVATYVAANGCVPCMQALLAAGVQVNTVLDNQLSLNRRTPGTARPEAGSSGSAYAVTSRPRIACAQRRTPHMSARACC
jgi:ankyrin repeat protein